MREILFRGKRTDNGEWVKGDLIHSLGRTYCGIYAETLEEVDPETVGQYTGLTASGKKIFEGDIVQYYGTYALEVFIENGHTQIRWFDTATKSDCAELFFGDDEAFGECEVIGNIHDNPELLKKEE